LYADEFSIYSGNANRPLAEDICRYLGTRMGEADVFQFQNENIFVRILENVREQDVFLVQPTCRPVNHSIMELLIMIDAFKRASAGRITAVMPYYSYGRSDKKDQPRVPITARLVADMLTVAGADRVLTMDLHQGQIQGFFSIPVDELTAVDMLARYITGLDLEDVVVVSELGFAKKARSFAEKLQAPLAIVEKRRTGNDDQAELKNVIGEVEGRTAVIIDDEINTGGSLIETVNALIAEGARGVYSCATHGIFSGSAIDRINASALKQVIVTDTIPLPEDTESDRITILSVAPLFGEAIKRIHRGESVGALFTSEVELVEEMTFWGAQSEDEDEEETEAITVER
jgi:ribose-phosphate pyrophosphokinase